MSGPVTRGNLGEPALDRSARPSRTGDGASARRKAGLNLAATSFDHVVRVLVQLVMNPIVLVHLGPALFGVWQILTRLMSFLALATGNPAQTLRFLVATGQDARQTGFRRQSLGAAVGIWVVWLPVGVGLGLAVVVALPRVLGSEVGSELRIAAALLVVATLLRELAVLPANVLAGMNQGYRLLGVKSGSQIVAAVVTWLLLVQGLGLSALALAQVLGVVALATGGAAVAWHRLSWFGADRPPMDLLRSQLRLNGWYLLSRATNQLLLAGEVLLVGIVAPPAVVASYVIVGFAATTLATGGAQLVGANVANFGRWVSAGAVEKIDGGRRGLQTLLLFGFSTIGLVILFLNRTFVGLWVGPELFAGQALNLVLLLSAGVASLARVEEMVLDLLLEPRGKVKVMGIAALVSVLGSIALGWWWGALGVAVAFLIGRLLLLVLYRRTADRSWGARQGSRALRLSGRVLVGGAVVLLAAVGGVEVALDGWLGLVTASVVAVPAAALVTFMAILLRDERRLLTREVRRLVSRLRRSGSGDRRSRGGAE